MERAGAFPLGRSAARGDRRRVPRPRSCSRRPSARRASRPPGEQAAPAGRAFGAEDRGRGSRGALPDLQRRRVERVEAISAAEALEAGLSRPSAAIVERLVRRALESEDGTARRRVGRVAPGAPFVWELGPESESGELKQLIAERADVEPARRRRIVEGVIDLVYAEGDRRGGWRIADWENRWVGDGRRAGRTGRSLRRSGAALCARAVGGARGAGDRRASRFSGRTRAARSVGEPGDRLTPRLSAADGRRSGSSPLPARSAPPPMTTTSSPRCISLRLTRSSLTATTAVW